MGTSSIPAGCQQVGSTEEVKFPIQLPVLGNDDVSRLRRKLRVGNRR